MQLVMIVEDDVLQRAAMSRTLNKLPSIEAIEASTIAEAVRLVGGLEVDLVLSELELPDGSALELLPHLERLPRRIPAVMMAEPSASAGDWVSSGIEVRTKPLPMLELRTLIAQRLGCPDERTPFALSDYLQLAALGHHSVQIELSNNGGWVGEVLVRVGQAWHARDLFGDGLDALVRMLPKTEIAIACHPLPQMLPPRSLEGGADQQLIVAWRQIDELRAGKTPGRGAELVLPVTVTPNQPSIVRIPPRRFPQASNGAALHGEGGDTDAVSAAFDAAVSSSEPTFARGTRDSVPARAPATATPPTPAPAPAPAVVDAREFDRLCDQGIEAMLAKKYQQAFDALMRAKSIKSTPTLEANLNRLRSMGAT